MDRIKNEVIRLTTQEKKLERPNWDGLGMCRGGAVDTLVGEC